MVHNERNMLAFIEIKNTLRYCKINNLRAIVLLVIDRAHRPLYINYWVGFGG